MTDLQSVTLSGSHYAITRDGDGEGDSGIMFNSINPTTGDIEATGEVKVGNCIQCGTPFARTMQWQDWWMTTPVLEILEVNEDKTEVRFKTKNSIYTARAR